MKKSAIKHKTGTAEYIVMHALWLKSRGRRPSATLSWQRDPRKALAWAKRFAYFPESGTYLNGETPSNYKCGKCGATGVKLWRDYQTFLEHQSLLCLNCACEEQKKTRTPTEDGESLYTDKVHHWYRTATMETGWWRGYDPAKGAPSDVVETKSEKERTDQIGWRVPAVPTEDGVTFWGYTSVPQAGCDWWASLPYLPA